MEQKLSPRRRLYDSGLRLLVWLCAGLTCALLLFLIGYIFYRGMPRITLVAADQPDQLYQRHHRASCPTS